MTFFDDSNLILKEAEYHRSPGPLSPPILGVSPPSVDTAEPTAVEDPLSASPGDEDAAMEDPDPLSPTATDSMDWEAP